MPHAFAGAFQKAGRVVERRPVEEADIHMRTEGVDVPKRRISHTRGGTAIVQKFANVRSAAAHLFEPWLGDPPQLAIRPGKPRDDAGVSLNGTREPQEFAHGISLPARPAMSRWRCTMGPASFLTMAGLDPAMVSKEEIVGMIEAPMRLAPYRPR